MLNYKELNRTEELVLFQESQKILKLFIDTDSQYEINCNKKEMKKVQEMIENKDVDIHIFDTLFKEVEKNMKDTLIRFYSSEPYRNYKSKGLKRRSNSFIITSLKPRDFTSELHKCSSFDIGSVPKKVPFRGVLSKLKQIYKDGFKKI